MFRFSLGWSLIKSSWAVLRADRSLMVFSVIAVVGGYGVMLIASGIGAGIANGAGARWLVVPFLLLALYLAVLTVAYCNVALAAATREVMDGRDVTVAHGLGLARRRSRQIAGWAGVQFTFGLLVAVVGSVLNRGTGTRLGSVVSNASGFAWSIATFFVVPVIALEGLGPRAAFTRSVGLIKQRWGDAFIGRTGIGLVVFLIAVGPVFGLLAGASALERSSPVAAGVGYAVGALVFLVAFALGWGLGIVFRVELYRYATEGHLTGSFETDDMRAVYGFEPGPAPTPAPA